MIVRYGPGSLVSRERPALAAARVLNNEYCIPLAVVTNGRNSLLLDTVSGKVIDDSENALPSREKLLHLLPSLRFLPPQDEDKRIREKRILNAFDLEQTRIRLINAQNSLTNAKYDFVFKTKVLDFYIGKQIIID